jgi:hypothetical protein
MEAVAGTLKRRSSAWNWFHDDCNGNDKAIIPISSEPTGIALDKVLIDLANDADDSDYDTDLDEIGM